MKKVLILALVVVSQITIAQVTRDLGDFNSIKVFDQLKVSLIQANENKIIITGNREKDVEVVTKNGELKIRMPFPKLLSGNEISINLYFKKIESIATYEGSNVSNETTFKQTAIDLEASEGSHINIDLDVEKANVRVVSGGIIDLSGKANNQNCAIATGGIYNGKELHTSQTEITVSAGGEAEIYATLLADAKVKAGGSISIYGKPKQINQKTILGGTIKEIK